MTTRSLAAGSIAAAAFALLIVATPARADPNGLSAQLCWAIGEFDHTVYFAEIEGREDRQESFASLMEISGLRPQSVQCRTQELKSHRIARTALLKLWRESELEIVNTTFLSDLDY